ncbi:MAG: PduL/EutD family phosphate acyltransferase [Oscillospiraceae bacterium]|jgi:putative phosphotransacetylase
MSENMIVEIEGSGRHVHLNDEAAKALFGTADLPVKRPLTLPSVWVYDAKLTLVGPRGKIEGVSVLGPHRKDVQVELSFTDARILGINPPIRNSGDTKDSAPIKLIGPKGELDLKEGAIVANRHIHMCLADAEKYGFKDKDVVKVRMGKERCIVMENVLVRLLKDAPFSNMHIDYDEQNAAGLSEKPMLGEVIKY